MISTLWVSTGMFIKLCLSLVYLDPHRTHTRQALDNSDTYTSVHHSLQIIKSRVSRVHITRISQSTDSD